MNGTFCMETKLTGIEAETYHDAIQQIVESCKKRGLDIEMKEHDSADNRTYFTVDGQQDGMLKVVSSMSHIPLTYLDKL